jgi:hypothetical protein
VRTLGALRSPELEVVATAPDGEVAGIGEDLDADEAELTITVRGGAGDSLVLRRNAEPFGLPIPITADPFTTTVPIERDERTEGPLGTWVRVETVRSVPGSDRQVEVEGEGVDDAAHSHADRAGEEGDHEGHDHPASAAALEAAAATVFPTTIANPVVLTGADDGTDGGEADDGDSDDGDTDGVAEGVGDAGDGPDAGTPEGPAAVALTAASSSPLPVTGSSPWTAIGPVALAGAAALATRRRRLGGA